MMLKQQISSKNRRGLTVGGLLLGLVLSVTASGGEPVVADKPGDSSPKPPAERKAEPEPEINGIKILYEILQARMKARHERAERSMRCATKISIQHVESAAKMYATDHDGEYPESMDQLVEPELINGVKQEPYLIRSPRDAWKTPIRYEPPAQPADKPLIVSFGPNKKEGGGDDITNLDDEQNKAE